MTVSSTTWLIQKSDLLQIILQYLLLLERTGKSLVLFSEKAQSNPHTFKHMEPWGALVWGYSLHLSEANGSISNKEIYFFKWAI